MECWLGSWPSGEYLDSKLWDPWNLSSNKHGKVANPWNKENFKVSRELLQHFVPLQMGISMKMLHASLEWCGFFLVDQRWPRSESPAQCSKAFYTLLFGTDEIHPFCTVPKIRTARIGLVYIVRYKRDVIMMCKICQPGTAFFLTLNSLYIRWCKSVNFYTDHASYMVAIGGNEVTSSTV
jgi:hypothetical protein